MKTIRYFLPFVCGLLASNNSFAQNENYQGTITDAETGYPLSYANVYVPLTQQGMYANDEGVYLVNFKDATDNDSIFFSHIGYESFRTTITGLKKINGNVFMRANQYNLNEVIITPFAAKELLQLAVRKVKDNYPTDYSRMRLVFKDFSRRSGHRSHYFYFDFDAYLKSYQGEKAEFSTKVREHQMYDKKGELTASMKPTDLMRLAMLEKSFEDEKLKDFEFKYLDSETFEGEDFDVIGFKAIPTKKNSFVSVRGRVFIGKTNKAIRYVEVSIKSEKAKRFMLVAKMDSLNILVKSAFKPYEGKYVLDYVVQTTFAKGKFFGKPENLVYSTTARAVEHQLKLKQSEIYLQNDVKVIFDDEKPKDISLLKDDPDMKLK